MKSVHKFSYLLILATISLVLGVINYFLFRPHIILFKWLGIEPVNSIAINHNILIPIFKNYFSDIAWCIALCLLLNYLSTRKFLLNSDKLIVFIVPFVTEVGQYFSFLPGTFDWFDMLAYAIIILIFNKKYLFTLIDFNMKKIKSHLTAIGVSIIFLIMVFACAAPKRTSYRAPPDPCVRHAALSYSPVLVQINIDGSYTMKDLSGAQRSGQVYFMDALRLVNPYKYQISPRGNTQLKYIHYN